MENWPERFMPEMTGEIRHEHLHRYALACEFVKDKEVLDIACGEGYGAATLARVAKSVVGVDIDGEIIHRAQRQYGDQPNLRFQTGSCDAIPLPDHSVDVVTSFETLEHHDKHAEMMREIKRVLRPGGLLIISSPNRPVYSEEPNVVNPFHVRELDYQEFLVLLKEYFEHVRIYGQKVTAGSFVFPLGESSEASFAAYVNDGNQSGRRVFPLESPVYFVAICSDVELKDGKPLESIYLQAHEDLFQDTRGEFQRLQVAHQHTSWALEEIRSSLSFKVVTRIVWPLTRKLVPNLLRSQLTAALRKGRTWFSRRPTLDHRRSGNEQLIWSIETDLRKPLVVGKGNLLFVKGWCYHPGRRIKTLNVLVDGKSQPVVNHSMGDAEVLSRQISEGDDSGLSLTSGFWTALSFQRIDAPQEINLDLRAVLDNGGQADAHLGTLMLVPSPEEQQQASLGSDDQAQRNEPLVAVCMATYNPPADWLTQQVDSLIAQTHRNWICIINDDCSAESSFREVQRIAARDARFRVYRNHNRLGFYRNFERCLQRVPDGIDFVALCDQDDVWYPEKLASCLDAFQDATKLVYSDMDIVTSQGEVLSHTYWTARENNFTDFGTLLFANTVTGASLVFRPGLLNTLLPFPELPGELFHDHWIACVGMAMGDIGYVDKPLYAYRQHSTNVHGHRTGGEARPWTEFRGFAYLMKLFLKGATDSGEYLSHLRHVYFCLLVRVILIARVLKLRVDQSPADKREVIERYSGFERSLSSLGFEAARLQLLRRSTLGIDMLSLRAMLSLRLFKHYCRWNRQHFYQQCLRPGLSELAPSVAPPADAKLDASAGVDFIDQKIAPLKLSISPAAPRTVNIIISEIDFNHVLAGYLCVFNLALALGRRRDYRVRLVIVDPCDYQPSQWKRTIASYGGLGNLFDVVETAYLFDRSRSLKVNPADVFIATSWWTAHIAHHAATDLGRDGFVFLIQDYEPLFHPAGSFFALAQQAYAFPHQAIFSTEVLRDYFQQNQIGAYAPETIRRGDKVPIVIRNAVSSVKVSEDEISSRRQRRFLFYARPEERYTARNVFELGVLALREVIREGHFDSQQWEFHGIGAFSKYKSVPLHHGLELKMMPKVSLPEFEKLLPKYDLGLSLMLTPHPSLMPLDMAAAGLVTVTNTFATKTSEKMREISSNIIAVTPTVDGLKSGLIAGLAEVDNFEKRVAGARINWSTSWSETFGNGFMAELDEYIGSQ